VAYLTTVIGLYSDDCGYTKYEYYQHETDKKNVILQEEPILKPLGLNRLFVYWHGIEFGNPRRKTGKFYRSMLLKIEDYCPIDVCN